MIPKRMTTVATAVMAVIMFSLVFPATASTISVGTVTVDGIMTGTEYTGANSGMKSVEWWNDHHSVYNYGDNQNPMHWEINNTVAYGISLNLFFEVPDYARRMIWSQGCNYQGSGGTWDNDCADLAPSGNTAYLDAYFDGSHHGEVKMDYGTQTGSEYFRLNDKNFSEIFKKKWQDEDDDPNNDNITWKTSREYLIDNGICTTSLCLEFNTTASLELMYLNLGSEQIALDLIASIENMQLHLSDEARGLPPVPVPAAVWLFGTALIGLVGFSKRRKAA